MSTEDRPSSHIERLSDPASELKWSDEFVMQGMELLVVALADGEVMTYEPEHAGSFIVGWPARERPEEVGANTLKALGLDPIVLHSTSWRHQGDEVILTYLAVVEGFSKVPDSWKRKPAGRADLARGESAAPPTEIDIDQVLEHALRHLAWLVTDDPVIGGELENWQEVLSEYTPEPFRAFGSAAPPR